MLIAHPNLDLQDSSTELTDNKNLPNGTTQARAPSILGADDDFVMVELVSYA